MKLKTDQLFKNNWKLYSKLGLIPYPASKNGKNPIVQWKDDLPDPVSDDFIDWEEKYPDANLWVKIGDGFAVIDPDGPGAERFVRSLNLPKCPVSISGKKSTHRWSKLSSPLKPIKVKMDDGSFLEFRTGQMGMFVPPSIHPETQKPYRWVDGQSPWEIPFPEFPIEVYEKIRDLLPKPKPRMMPTQIENLSLGSLDVERYLTHYGIKYKVKQDGNRTIYALDHCLFAENHTTKDIPGDSSIIQGPDGKLGYHCFHNHCSNRTWQDARKAISGEDSIAQFCRGYISVSSSQEKTSTLSNRIEDALLNADDLIKLEIPPKKKILNPWLTERSITLISAWRGTGKTWFGLSIFDAISRGESFVGPWNVEPPFPCLYVDGEMFEGDAQERLKKLLKGNLRKAPLIIYSDSYANSLGIKRANLLSPQWRGDIKALLMDKGIRLLGLDNISSLASGIDENKKEQWDPINQWLIDLRFNNISTMLFHHTSKAGDQRGTSAREDNIDISIILHGPHDYRIEEGARFIIKFKKSRVSIKDFSLMQDYEFRLTEADGHVEWVWNSVKGKNRIEILRMIDEGIAQVDIANTLGIDKAYVSRVKSQAIKDGYLSEKGKLTQSGFLLVNSKEIEDEI